MQSGRVLRLSQQMEPQDLAPLFEDEWTGSQIWPCSERLASLIETRVAAGAMDLAGRDVIELGSGCGLVALTACVLGARVAATDQVLCNVNSCFRRLFLSGEAVG